MRMRPAVVPPPPPPFAFKWAGNANMATVGERKGSGVQATGSAGGRLSEEGVLGGGVPRDGRDCTTHPVSLPRLLHHSPNVWAS